MNRKFENRSKGFKIATLALALVLVSGASVAGTLAWLTSETTKVTNTFTSAELFGNPTNDFTLWEYQADLGENGKYTLNTNKKVEGNAYDILPGVNIPKNPTVDVVNLEEYAYLYIKVTGLPMTTGLRATIEDSNWKALDTTEYPGVYVYSGSYADASSHVIKATDEGKKTFTATILKDNQIEVSDTYADKSDNISLSFQAYMVQATGNGNDAAGAWGNTYGKNN